MNEVAHLFIDSNVDNQRIEQINALPEPRSRYIIAITPRSGSSYLCDMMARTRRLGLPIEAVNEELMPGILTRIPGRTPEEYLRNVMRVKKTRNGVSGLKASWFQFRNFLQPMKDQTHFKDFKYIYLIRRSLAAQAVSLYKATASGVFHSNVQHGEDAIAKLNSLDYDYEKIREWYTHIVQQEFGWKDYFYCNRIFPLCLTYEDIEIDILGVLKRIATYVGVNPNNVKLPDEPSVFKRINDRRNTEWAQRFSMEYQGIEKQSQRLNMWPFP
jgi:trehalose 2-sulfotransferase